MVKKRRWSLKGNIALKLHFNSASIDLIRVCGHWWFTSCNSSSISVTLNINSASPLTSRFSLVAKLAFLDWPYF